MKAIFFSVVFVVLWACQHKPTEIVFSSQNLKPGMSPSRCLTEQRIPSMGTFFEMQLVHECSYDPQKAVSQAKAVLDSIEAPLSLYQEDSQLSRLNREGRLCGSSPHLLKMVEVSRRYFELTEGAFDVSILPVLKAIEESFAKNNNPPRNLQRLRSLVNSQQIRVQGDCVSFVQPGMALSFDGIAKGYAVDVVAESLPPNISGYLLNFSGNMRWQGRKPNGPWKIAAWNPVKRQVIPLEVGEQGAIASSGPEHAHFDPKQKWHHLIDPKTLKPMNYYSSVTVIGETAMECDVLSTSFSSWPLKHAREMRIQNFPRIKLMIVDLAGVETPIFDR